eukprot:6214107-Pleurochrysis_carterae.AAC.1
MAPPQLSPNTYLDTARTRHRAHPSQTVLSGVPQTALSGIRTPADPAFQASAASGHGTRQLRSHPPAPSRSIAQSPVCLSQCVGSHVQVGRGDLKLKKTNAKLNATTGQQAWHAKPN